MALEVLADFLGVVFDANNRAPLEEDLELEMLTTGGHMEDSGNDSVPVLEDQRTKMPVRRATTRYM